MTQSTDSQAAHGATGNRAETEDRLTAAALRLIERNGVLAGINLREVADEADVNRGLIYHYFGSRRDLLRAAINQLVAADRAITEARSLPFRARRRRMFDVIARAPRFARLTGLLAIDGDDSFPALPQLDASLGDMRRDIEQGHLPPETDVVALHVVTSAAMRGYAIYRHAFARNLGVAVRELDERASAVFDQLLGALDPAERS